MTLLAKCWWMKGWDLPCHVSWLKTDAGKNTSPLPLALKLTLRITPACSEHHQSLTGHLEIKFLLCWQKVLASRIKAAGNAKPGESPEEHTAFPWAAALVCSTSGVSGLGIPGHLLSFPIIIIALTYLLLTAYWSSLIWVVKQAKSTAELLILH